MLGSPRLTPAASSAFRPAVGAPFFLLVSPQICIQGFEKRFTLDGRVSGGEDGDRAFPALLRLLQWPPWLRRPALGSDGGATRRQRWTARVSEEGVAREKKRRKKTISALRADRTLF